MLLLEQGGGATPTFMGCHLEVGKDLGLGRCTPGRNAHLTCASRALIVRVHVIAEVVLVFVDLGAGSLWLLQ